MLMIRSDKRLHWPDYVDQGKIVATKEVNPTLCVSCGLSVQSKPCLVKCDECQSSWHLDCIDEVPTTAAPLVVDYTKEGPKPVPGLRRMYWRCPRHIAQNMYLLEHPSVDNDGKVLSRGHKIRKALHPEVVKPAFDRGHRNDGENIELEYSSDEEADMVDEGYEPMPNINSTVYKISAKAVKLDFIAKAKRFVHSSSAILVLS
jgi:hypothetical protein